MAQKIKYFQCSNIGVSFTTNLYIQNWGTGNNRRFEARIGVAIFGYAHQEGGNPFDESYRNNYCVGFGSTEEESIENLIKDLRSLSEILFL